MPSIPSVSECSQELIEVIPALMQTIRSQIRSQRSPDLSVLQVRVLAFLDYNAGATLSAVAEHVGLTLPSMSTQVTGLVARKLIDRASAPTDRRYIALTLTAPGRAKLAAARHGAQVSLAQILTKLTADERVLVMQSLQILRTAFATAASPTAMETTSHE